MLTHSRKLLKLRISRASQVVAYLCLLCFAAAFAAECSWAQSGYEDQNRAVGMQEAGAMASIDRAAKAMTAGRTRSYVIDDPALWRPYCKQYKISEAVSSLMIRANQSRKKKDLDQVRRLYEEAIKAAPNNSIVRLTFASALLDVGDRQGAIRQCDALLAKLPEKTLAGESAQLPVLQVRAFCFFENKQYQKGVDDMTAIIKIYQQLPSLDEPLYRRAMDCAEHPMIMQKGRVIEVSSVVQVFSPDLNNAWAFTERAKGYRKLGMMDKAIKDDLQARQLNAVKRADALESAGKLGEAQGVLDEALSNDPNNKDLHRSRAKLLMMQGHYDDACKETSAYMTADDWEPYLDRGRAYEGAEKLTQAISDYSQAIKLMKPVLLAVRKKSLAGPIEDMRLLYLPGALLEALQFRARVYVKANRPLEAINDCNEYQLMLEPSAEIRSIRADAFEMVGKWKEALSEYQVVIKAKPIFDKSLKVGTAMDIAYAINNSKAFQPIFVHCLMQTALVADKLSDTQTAINYYSELIRMKPGESEFYLDRAKEFEKLKQYDKAGKDLDKFITLEPKDSVAYDLRARVKAEQGKYSDAVNNYTAALKAAPEDAAFLLGRRSKIYEQMGRKDLANQDMAEILRMKQAKE